MRVFERGGRRREVALDPLASSPIKAKWDADRECKQLLAEGWTQVAGGIEELASKPELFAAIAEDPDDLEPYTILADWLIERGDPWGQLIAIQHALAGLHRFAAGAKRDELAREEAHLMFMSAQRLWGPLGATIVDDATQRYASDLLDCEWKCGFIRRARGRATAEQLELVIRELAALDIAAFLNSLYLETEGWRRTFGDALAAHAWPALRELELTSTYALPTGRLDARLVVPMLAPEITPVLTTLTLEGTHSTDGLCLALATNPIGRRLEKLTLLDGQFTEEGIAYLQGGRFDKLRRLRISGSGPRTAGDALARLAPSTEVHLRDGYLDEG
ncbi:MAG TPA: TIGR02996 domain-containing protein [Kofleriaceae bacterium]|nr:TIGR02996 domain-containing protein [Kofleriaceae bacterium]